MLGMGPGECSSQTPAAHATWGFGCDHRQGRHAAGAVLPAAGVGELCFLALAVSGVDDVVGDEVAPQPTPYQENHKALGYAGAPTTSYRG
jgi:hypothetical protein